jgi:hypothetical protein
MKKSNTVLILTAIIALGLSAGCNSVSHDKAGNPRLTEWGRIVAGLFGKTVQTNAPPPAASNSIPSTVETNLPAGGATKPADASPAGAPPGTPAGTSFGGEALYRTDAGAIVFADGSRAQWNDPRKRWSRDRRADNFPLYPPGWKGDVPTGSGMYATSATSDDGMCYTGPGAGEYWLLVSGVWTKQPAGMVPPAKVW